MRPGGQLRATALLARAALAEALGRRLAVVLAAMAGLALLTVDQCTAAIESGALVIDGRSVDLAALGPALGIPTFLVLALWVVAVAALLGADALAAPLEDGEATLWLGRPVSRASYALARLAGAVGLALCVALLLLGASAALLQVRQGLAPGPALAGALAAALGALVFAALAMALSLHLPRAASVLLVELGLLAVALADLAALFVGSLGGWFGAAARYGPPVAALVLHAVAPWSPQLALRGEPAALALRLALWAAGSVALLLWLFRHKEVGGRPPD